MSETYSEEFNRIAERLVFSTIKNKLVEQYNIDGAKIFLQAPAHQYINTRTETNDKLEEDRFPTISIYSTDEYDDSLLGSYDMQQESYDSSGQITFFESDYHNCSYLDFVLETTTKKDYFELKNKLKLFFHSNKSFLIDDDILPERAGGVNLLLIDIEDIPYNSHPTVIFKAKCLYKIYKEYKAYMLQTYQIQIDVSLENELSENLNDNEDLEIIWDSLLY